MRKFQRGKEECLIRSFSLVLVDIAHGDINKELGLVILSWNMFAVWNL